MSDSGYGFCLISVDSVDVFPENTSLLGDESIALIQDAWRDISQKDQEKGVQLNSEWELINSLGERPTNFTNPRIRHFRNDSTGKRYFILIGSSIEFPWYELNLLVNYSKIENGFLPLHASAIKYRGFLFLFSGPSGAGKSTIASLSKRIGGEVLDQDQILIHEDDQGTFFANAWGYSLVRCAEPIKYIFKIIQDTENSLSKLSPAKVARFVFDRSLDCCRDTTVPQINKKILEQSSRIARTITGYELHFTKSPDFWELIDTELASD